MCDDPPQDRRGEVSFCYRDIAKTTVFIMWTEALSKGFHVAYPLLATDTEVNNCLSIYYSSEILEHQNNDF